MADLSGRGESGPRSQKIDKVALLALCPLFQGLSRWEIESVARMMRLVEYRRDEIVYEEGREPDSFYIVVSGRFEASTIAKGKKNVLSYLRRGDHFGEMSLLTGDPHSATVRSLSDSLVLELKKEDFKKTVEANASVTLEISRRLSSRLKATENRSRSLLKSDVISLFSDQQRIGRTAFSINLAASLFHETRQKTVLVDMSPSGQDISERLEMGPKLPLSHFHGIEHAEPDAMAGLMVKHAAGFDVLNLAHPGDTTEARERIIPILNHLAIEYRFILIDLPGRMDETVLTALSQSDQLFFVTDNKINNISETRDMIAELEKRLSIERDRISVVINEAFFGVRTTPAIKKEMFGDRLCYSLPGTPEIDRPSHARVMPYAIEEPDADYSRIVRHIARRLSNNLVGLVLGSGAAFGLAHIGVLKVLERERIPIDIIAGCSIGALIGAIYAIHVNAKTVESAALEINSIPKMTQLLDFTLNPVLGAFNGKRVVRHFRSHLGDKTFEDCRIPFKAVGSNLSKREVVVFDSGSIPDAVRASVAIPAIFKPVISNGEVIVDGGILDPLPIRVLQHAGAHKIIAVNVFPSAKEIWEKRILRAEAQEKEDARMRRRNILARCLYALRKRITRLFFPNFIDILMNTIQYMESEMADIEGEHADIVLRPVVVDANWAEVYKPEQFIRRGEEEAMRALPKIKALVSQPNL